MLMRGPAMPFCLLLAGLDPRFAGNAPAELAQLARPRYHIAGGQSVFFTRLPYANPDLGAGPRATRFVSLGSVVPRLKLSGAAAAAAADAAAMAAAAAVAQEVIGPGGAAAAAAGGGRGRAGIGHVIQDQAAVMAAAAATTAAAATAAATAVAEANKQQKFLHALALVPASSLSIEQLGTLPEGCGAYPYEQQQQVGQKRGSGSTYDHVSSSCGGLGWVEGSTLHMLCIAAACAAHLLPHSVGMQLLFLPTAYHHANFACVHSIC